MKRAIFILSTVFVLFSCKNNLVKKNDLNSENLKGNVVGFINVEYKALEKFGEPVKGELNSDIYGSSFVKTFDLNGNIVEFLRLFGLDKSLTYKYYYDESGRLSFIDYFDLEDKLISKFKYEYDSDSKIKNIKQYNGNGELLFVNEFNYNELNQLIKEVPYTPTKKDPINQSYKLYKYFGDSLKTHSELTPNGIIIKTDKYKVDKLIESIDAANKDTIKYEFNENGDISIERRNISKFKLKTMYNYKYDSQGNWIEMIKYITQDIPNKEEYKPFTITYRTIFYGPESAVVRADSILNTSTYKKEYLAKKMIEIQERNCNEIHVRENIIENFKTRLPDWKIILESLSISVLGDCKYRAYFVLQSKEYSYLKKKITFLFSYSNDFSIFEITEFTEDPF